MTRIGAGALVALAAAFVIVPLLAILLRLPPGALADGLSEPAAVDALLLSLRTTTIALAIMLAVGTPVAFVLARRPFPGARIVSTILELPVVLPPAVAGVALLYAFGRFGTVGGVLRAAGVEIAFTTAAVVLAQLFVAAPLYLRQAQAAFAAIDPRLEDAARSCGAGPTRLFLRVAVPVAAGGLVAGAALAWARALGEFGATLLFAGSLQGVTQTAPLAIYALLDGSTESALGLSVVLVTISFAVLIGVRLSSRRWSTPW